MSDTVHGFLISVVVCVIFSVSFFGWDYLLKPGKPLPMQGVCTDVLRQVYSPGQKDGDLLQCVWKKRFWRCELYPMGWTCADVGQVPLESGT
jgi:hypothetical protein